MAERSILITGCSSGIGLCAAQTFKARGWRVFATARQPEDITRLKSEIGVESLYPTTPSLTRSQQRLSVFCRQRTERWRSRNLKRVTANLIPITGTHCLAPHEPCARRFKSWAGFVQERTRWA